MSWESSQVRSPSCVWLPPSFLNSIQSGPPLALTSIKTSFTLTLFNHFLISFSHINFTEIFLAFSTGITASPPTAASFMEKEKGKREKPTRISARFPARESEKSTHKAEACPFMKHCAAAGDISQVDSPSEALNSWKRSLLSIPNSSPTAKIATDTL